tara:strand:- start:52 stop:234 length:183 start_codon:yes stop_codon:yes gene_type:complete
MAPGASHLVFGQKGGAEVSLSLIPTLMKAHAFVVGTLRRNNLWTLQLKKMDFDRAMFKSI